MPFYRDDGSPKPTPMLEQISDTEFKLHNKYKYVWPKTDAEFVVPRQGSNGIYDLASVPGVLRFLVPTYGAHTLAALLHDDLITGDTPAKARMCYDKIFYDAMGELGVAYIRKQLLWSGPALGALAKTSLVRRAAFYAWLAIIGLGAALFWWTIIVGVPAWLPTEAIASTIGLMVVVMFVALLLVLPNHARLGLIAPPAAIVLILPVAGALAARGVSWLSEQVARMLGLERISRWPEQTPSTQEQLTDAPVGQSDSLPSFCDESSGGERGRAAAG